MARGDVEALEAVEAEVADCAEVPADVVVGHVRLADEDDPAGHGGEAAEAGLEVRVGVWHGTAWGQDGFAGRPGDGSHRLAQLMKQPLVLRPQLPLRRRPGVEKEKGVV